MTELSLADLYQGFRHPLTIQMLAQKVQKLAAQLKHPIKVMEVCGGHTHTIMKYGLSQLLPKVLSEALPLFLTWNYKKQHKVLDQGLFAILPIN